MYVRRRNPLPGTEPLQCVSCPAFIAGMNPYNYCFECLDQDHTANNVKKPVPCAEYQPLPLVRRQQCLDCIQCLQIEVCLAFHWLCYS